jgi:cytochrome c
MMVSMLVLCFGWVPILFFIPTSKVDPKARLASLPAPYRGGDLAKGEAAFKACVSCHTLSRTGQKLNGPNLFRIFERRAGTREGFAYSPGMKAAGFTWNAERLDRFVADPQAVVPGTSMPNPNVTDPTTRVNLVAYLKAATETD